MSVGIDDFGSYFTACTAINRWGSSWREWTSEGLWSTQALNWPIWGPERYIPWYTPTDSCPKWSASRLSISLCSWQETSWAGPPVNGCRKEEINTFHQNQDFTPSPFSIKEARILTQGRWFFGTLVHHLLSLLAFRIKSLFLAPTAHFLIYWPVMG